MSSVNTASSTMTQDVLARYFGYGLPNTQSKLTKETRRFNYFISKKQSQNQPYREIKLPKPNQANKIYSINKFPSYGNRFRGGKSVRSGGLTEQIRSEGVKEEPSRLIREKAKDAKDSDSNK
ncbi:hypothetical protein FGO68_gene13990 [Halteria grandinella]|uniref:Uncharacterized protein n=1 Tax=Halteria grandinella TaxID=5974 RepID=A0A8J8NPU9_HALGN|nr:hypothetical protein FGO68_gene13990 [Halteria grandinella]